MFLTPQEAAERKGVSRQSIINILSKKERREAIFPNARYIGEGKRGVWQIPENEVDAWQPRDYPRAKDPNI